ncbi:MAG: LytTR family transcriptional regulator DNA-binding domain-containing protein [Bacteroidales bacterium]|nr:LytTR family transcriptional regulator DNA-binding domain-containing protein [Bacteroidales bacterium]
MKHLHTFVIISLNILFCAALLWFFTRNAFLRPYAGSAIKEVFAGILLLGSLYINYFLLYPKLYKQHAFWAYWFLVFGISLIAGVLDMVIAYPHISNSNAMFIETIGFTKYFAPRVLFIVGRNLAFNFFPFMLQERRQLQKTLENEVKVVYQQARLLDVCDKDNNCRHIPADNVLYCKKEGNYTYVYTVDGDVFTRYCSIKYMEQHLGDKEFIRISSSVIVPFKYVVLCDGNTVVMKMMPWMEEPLAFSLDINRDPLMADKIRVHLYSDLKPIGNGQPNISEKDKKSLSAPPKDKLDAVINYIQAHPGCQAKEIIKHTSFSKTTMDRCLLHLKQQGLIEHTGSKKSGGYKAVKNEELRMENEKLGNGEL